MRIIPELYLIIGEAAYEPIEQEEVIDELCDLIKKVLINYERSLGTLNKKQATRLVNKYLNQNVDI